MSENSSLMEKRYESFQNESKQLNQQIIDLQHSNRKLESELHQKSLTQAEHDAKVQKLVNELEVEKAKVTNTKDLERQVALLTVQLEESNKSITNTEAKAQVQLQQSVSQLQSQLEAAQQEKESIQSQITANNQQNEQQIQQLNDRIKQGQAEVILFNTFYSCLFVF